MAGVAGGGVAKAIFDFEASNEDELTFAVGESIELISVPEGGWWEGRIGGVSPGAGWSPSKPYRQGWFPSNHVAVEQVEASGEFDTENNKILSKPSEIAVTVDVGASKRDYANRLWLDADEVEEAQDNGTLFRLLAEAEKGYLQDISHALNEVLRPQLKTVQHSEAKIAIRFVEKEVALRRQFLVDVARESSRPAPERLEKTLIKWIPSMISSCTGLAAICGNLRAKKKGEARASSNDTSVVKTAVTDALAMPQRRLQELIIVVIRLQELGDHPFITNLLEMLSQASTTCDKIESATETHRSLTDIYESSGQLILSSSSEAVVVSEAPPVPADLCLFEGVLLIIQSCAQETAPTVDRHVIGRCPLQRADVVVDGLRIVVTSDDRSFSFLCRDTRECAVWSGELYDQSIDHPPGVENISSTSALRPFTLRLPVKDDKRDDNGSDLKSKRWRFRSTKGLRRASSVPLGESHAASALSAANYQLVDGQQFNIIGKYAS